MSVQLIPFLIIVLFPIVFWRRVSWLAAVALVPSFVSFGLAVLWDMQEPYELVSGAGMLFLSVCWLLAFCPLLALNLSSSRFVHPDERHVRTLALVVAIITVPATLYFLQYVNRIFATDISAMRVENKMDNVSASLGPIHRVFVSCAYFYILALGLLVYGFIRKCFSRWMMALLVVGSLSYPLSGIYLYSRGMTLLYGVTVFAFMVIGFSFCSRELRCKLLWAFMLVVLAIGLPFSYITIERFGDNRAQGFYEYVGGGPRFFSRIFYHREEWRKDPTAVALRPFSMIWDRLMDNGAPHERMLEVYDDNKQLTYSEESNDQPSAPFITLCGGWLSEFPAWVVLLLHLGVAVCFSRLLSRYSKEMTLTGLMVCGVYLVSCMMYPVGYLYFGTPGNVAFLLIAAGAVYLRKENPLKCI